MSYNLLRDVVVVVQWLAEMVLDRDREVLGSIPAPSKTFSRESSFLNFVGHQKIMEDKNKISLANRQITLAESCG